MICSNRFLTHLRWIITDVLKLARNPNRIAAIICKVWNCGKKWRCYVIRCLRRWSRWCSYKTFHSVPTMADSRRSACEVKLSSTLQASRRWMPGTDFNSAMNLHINMRYRCPRLCRRLRSWVCRGHMIENQALQPSRSATKKFIRA